MYQIFKMLFLITLWSGFLSAAESPCMEDPGYYVCKGSILSDAECPLNSGSPGKMVCTVSNSSDASLHSVPEESVFSFSVPVLTSARLSSINRTLSAECVKIAACTEKYSCLFYSKTQESLCYGINPHTKESF